LTFLKYVLKTHLILSEFSDSHMTPTSTPSSKHAGTQDGACLDAVTDILLPLARLCIANGVTFTAVEERLKQAFVQEANGLQPGPPAHGTVSRISTATGLTRREVTRLINADPPTRSVKPPVGTVVFARWTTDPAYLDGNGAPRTLKRQGPAPSFETLALSISRDVHPRSMLDELIRLGLVQHDKDRDTVSLISNGFVPFGDTHQTLDLLGDNIGDHFAAAVANVVQDGTRHLEQAVFADELSAESIQSLRPLIAGQWKALCDAMVPAIRALIESDQHAGRPQDQRLRIGMFSYDENMSNPGTPATTSAPPKRTYNSKESKK